MSPHFQRASLGLHFTWRRDPAGVAEVLPALEAALAPFGARPHWGKVFAAGRPGPSARTTSWRWPPRWTRAAPSATSGSARRPDPAHRQARGCFAPGGRRSDVRSGIIGSVGRESRHPQTRRERADEQLRGLLRGHGLRAQPPAGERLGGAEQRDRERVDPLRRRAPAAAPAASPRSARSAARGATATRRATSPPAGSVSSNRIRHAPRSSSTNAKKAWTPPRSASAGVAARSTAREHGGGERLAPPAPCTRGRAAPCCRSTRRAAAS